MSEKIALYICGLPDDTKKEELEELLGDLEGYKEVRICKDKSNNTIAFADFKTKEDLHNAKEYVNGKTLKNSESKLNIFFFTNYIMLKLILFICF